jgi:hypothetical protein
MKSPVRYTKLNDSTFQKWVRWLEKIEEDVSAMVNNQQIYKFFIDVVNANIKHINLNEGSLFCDFVRQCYGVQAATAIRRHIKAKHDDSISLMRLLKEMKHYASQFTYDFYLKQYPVINGQEVQKSKFQEFSDGGIIISEQKIDNDIQELEKLSRNITDLVDRRIAHLDRRSLKELVTYNDIEKSINTLNKMTCKYIRFIYNAVAEFSSLEATIQWDWEKIFSVPLDIRKL